MINPTELMQSILTSEEAQILIDHMSPIYGEARVFLWLLQAIGVGLDEAESCKDDFDMQSLIAKATWSLKHYEEQYGLQSNSDLTDEERRNKIFAKMRSSGQMNPARMESLLSAQAGVPVRIEENTGENTFSVISDITSDPASVDALVNRLKPAHLVYNFEIHPEYEGEGILYMGRFADVENEIVASNKNTLQWTVPINDGSAVLVGAGMSLAYPYEEGGKQWAPRGADVLECEVIEAPGTSPDLSFTLSIMDSPHYIPPLKGNNERLMVQISNSTDSDIEIPAESKMTFYVTYTIS